MDSIIDEDLEQPGINIECSPETFRRVQENPENISEILLDSGIVEALIKEAGCISGVEQRNITPTEECGNGERLIWLDCHVKLLLSCLQDITPKIGKSLRFKNKKKMWEEISKIFKKKGFNFTETQIENKYRSLERQYRKHKANCNATGENLKCPYADELSVLLDEKPFDPLQNRLSPKFILETDDEDEDERNQNESSDERPVWLDHQVKLLLSCLLDFKPQIGKSLKFRNRRKMYEEIARIFKERGINFTEAQIEGKYRALGRQFKKAQEHYKLTGQNKHKFPYVEEMAALLQGDSSDLTHFISIAEEDSQCTNEGVINEQPTSSKDQSTEELILEHSYNKESRDLEKAKKADLATELRLLRETKELYYKKALALQESHNKRKEELMEEKNRILKERNEFLKRIFKK